MAIPATIANNPDLYQEAYEAGVNEGLSTFTTVWGECPEYPGAFQGKYTKGSVRRRRPQGFSQGLSSITIPDASSSRNAEYTVFPTMWILVLQIDWSAIHTSKDNAYTSVIENELGPATESAIQAMERQSLGDGTATLATNISGVTAAGVALSFTVAGVDEQVYFEEGQRMEFMNALADATKRDNPALGFYEVDNVTVNVAADTITVNCTSDSIPPAGNPPVDGDFCVVAGAINLQNGPGPSNTTNECNGLDILIDDGNSTFLTDTPHSFPAAGTFQGIASTANFWQSKVVDGSGQYLDLDLAHNVLDQINNHAGGMGGEQINKIVAHSFQLRKYLLSLYPQERYPNEGATGQFTSGSTWMVSQKFGPKIGTIPTLKARYCKKGTVYFYGPSIQKYIAKPMGFYTDDNSMYRMAPGQPANMAILWGMMNLGIKTRNRSGKVEGLNTT